MTRPYDAIIVGAGPGGSAAATTLARPDRRILLLDKDSFPRRKVCGAFLSADAIALLQRLGMDGQIARCEPEKIAEGSVELPRASIPFRIPSPGLGLSRYVLDELLLRRAERMGAETRLGERVVSVRRTGESFRVQLAGGELLEARAAIGAWGRWDALDRSLGRSFLRGRRYFGFSHDFRGHSAHLKGRVRLYLFRGGYCGLSRVEGGTVNLAGIVSERGWTEAGSRWESVVDRMRRENRALDRDLAPLEPGPDGFLGTGPVFFTAKSPIEEGALMVGDAAGFLDPFSGEGQTTALASGILAGETVDAALSGALPMEAVGDAYANAWKRAFAGRFGWSALFRRLMLNPRFASAAARLAGPTLVRLGMRRLQGEVSH